MDTAVVVALISSTAGLLVALFSTARNARQARDLEQLKLDQQRTFRDEERSLKAEATLELHRAPLLAAAHDLHHRLGNIINDFEKWFAGFAASLDSPDAAANPRLDQLRTHLGELVATLDKHRLYGQRANS
jgi:hypothetical protein